MLEHDNLEDFQDAEAYDLDENDTGNAFQLFLTNADQAALLARVRAHLADDGLFAFETRNPLWRTPLTGADQEATVERARRRGDFVPFLETRDQAEVTTSTDLGGREVRESRRQAYDPIAQILHLTSEQRWREGDQARTKVTRIALRYTFPQDLAGLLHSNGFTIERQYGDWNGEPLTAASTSIIVVCRRRV